MSSETPPLPVPVADVFASFAAELRELAHRLDAIEAALSKLMAAAPQTAPDITRELIPDLQALDLIQQSLQSLGQFSEHLSGSAGPLPVIDIAAAARGINLSDLAARLTGQNGAARAAPPGGDIEYL